jgi:hypothetical protein
MKNICGTIFKTILITATVAFTLIVIALGLARVAHRPGADFLRAELQKPPLPISVAFRQAFFGPGGVAIFRNNSSQTLEVSAKIITPTNRYANFDFVIPSWGTKQIGPLDGWTFASGQHIELMNSNFKPTEISIQ